jgi:hypothetical protein
LFYLKKLNQQLYCDDRNIAPDQKMFSVGERQVQKYLKKVVDYLGYEEPIPHTSSQKKKWANLHTSIWHIVHRSVPAVPVPPDDQHTS